MTSSSYDLDTVSTSTVVDNVKRFNGINLSDLSRYGCDVCPWYNDSYQCPNYSFQQEKTIISPLRSNDGSYHNICPKRKKFLLNLLPSYDPKVRITFSRVRKDLSKSMAHVMEERSFVNILNMERELSELLKQSRDLSKEGLELDKISSKRITLLRNLLDKEHTRFGKYNSSVSDMESKDLNLESGLVGDKTVTVEHHHIKQPSMSEFNDILKKVSVDVDAEVIPDNGTLCTANCVPGVLDDKKD